MKKIKDGNMLKSLLQLYVIVFVFTSIGYSQEVIDKGEIYRFTGSNGNDVFSTLSTIRFSNFDSIKICGYASKLFNSLNLKLKHNDDNYFNMVGIKRDKDLRTTISLSRIDNYFFIIVQESAPDNSKFSVTQAQLSKQKVIHFTECIIKQVADIL